MNLMKYEALMDTLRDTFRSMNKAIPLRPSTSPPPPPVSLLWSQETIRHKINMVENVMFDVIAKVKHSKKDTLPGDTFIIIY